MEKQYAIAERVFGWCVWEDGHILCASPTVVIYLTVGGSILCVAFNVRCGHYQYTRPSYRIALAFLHRRIASGSLLVNGCYYRAIKFEFSTVILTTALFLYLFHSLCTHRRATAPACPTAREESLAVDPRGASLAVDPDPRREERPAAMDPLPSA